MVKVSVIMPVYNCEDFLKDSIESILNQTLSDLELICVDDGSTDNSLEILKKFESQDSRITVFALNHLGGGDARNFALNYVSGEYLYFMDADDTLDLNAFEIFYALSKEKNLDFLMFKAKRYDVVQKTLSEHNYYNMVPLSKFKGKVFNFNDLGDLIFSINVTPWCKFYNAEFVHNSGAKFRSQSKFHDNQFFWDIIFQAERIYFLDEFYYTQNVNPNSLIESAGKSHCDIFDVQNNIWELFKKHGQFDKFKQQLYNRKIPIYIGRYGEIVDEFKDLFFKKMKEDLTLMNCSDFGNYLTYGNKFVFDSVMISQNRHDFDILIEFYYILIKGSADANQKMNQAILWFNGLSKLHKRFSFNYIRDYFKNYELTPENMDFLNKFPYLISVIMPVYNCEDFLKCSVESILNQTFSDLELICVDDGSTDNSLSILKNYANIDSRVKVFELPHQGGGNARNFALKYVSGEYLYFMDADDELDLNAFEDFYSIAKSMNLDFLIFKAKKYDVSTGEYFETDYYNMTKLSNFVKEDVFKFTDIGDLIFNINVTPWCKFYNTQFILNTGAKFREQSKFHDNKFFWEMLFQAERIFFLDKFYYIQNIHSDSLIESCGERHIDAIPVSNDTIEIFNKYDQLDKFKVNVFNSKVYHNIRRYDEIREEFKELYFTELKKDFKLLKYSDFRNNLYLHNKFFYDCVFIAKNYEDFNHLKGFSEVFTNNNLSNDDKIEKYNEWYDSLDDDYKQLFYEKPNSMNIYNYLISVIIPTYNSKSFIKNTFNSLLRQTIGFEKLEVIFVDDASSDNTPQIIVELAEKYENVVSLHLDENSGAGGKPRNVGMDYATAEYMMFLDSDDLFFEDACEFLYDEITKEDIDIVSGTITMDGENVAHGFWENILTNPEDNHQVRMKKVKELVTDDFTLKINTIDDCESVIANFGFSSKIYRKSFLLENNIYFPHSTVAEDSVFLLNALLNANGIKFINKLVYHYIQRSEEENASINHTITKRSMINRLDSYFQMFLICMKKNKSEICKKYLLFYKLNYFINSHLLKCNLNINDLLDVLVHASLLFRLYMDYNPNLNEGKASLFKYIANKDYENAIKEICGHELKNQKDIKVAASSDKFSKDSFNFPMFVLNRDSWVEQLESEKPDIFLFKSQDRDDEILNYCYVNNIQSVQWDEPVGNLTDILNSINFKYVPYIKHLVLIYRLNKLDDLNDVTNHFHSINYHFKHLKMIVDEENLFLSNTICESDLASLDFGDNYYYCFADLDFEFNVNDFDKIYKKFTYFKKENAQNKTCTKVENLSREELSKLTPEELKNYYIYQYVPESVRIDASTICQLKCAGCKFQNGEWDGLGRGYLTFENFKKFCDMNPFIKEIELSNFGEIFLNPDLIDIMYYAKERGIVLHCYTGSNFNTVTDEQIHALVDTGFKAILLSIDGASQETYSKYRIGGDFDKVMENVKKLQELKEKTGSQFPKLQWQYILMEHNELEIGKAKKMAAEMDIPIFFKYNWDPTYEPVHREYLIKQTGKKELTRAEYIASHDVGPYDRMCEKIFKTPQINWDGRMLGCSDKIYATFDVNVFEVGLVEAIRSPKYIAAKECLMTLHPDKEKYGTCVCFDCPTRKLREKAELEFKL